MRERLYRSRDDRMLFGVAGGMADWMDLDPAVVRLVWALLVVFGGAGLLLYVVAAIVIPEEPLEAPDAAGMATSAGGADAGGAPGSTGAAGAPAAGTWTYPSSRAERRAARRAARAARGPSNAPIVVGAILVLVGGWLLLREVFPFFDDRFVGPAILIGIGILLVLAAVRRPQPPAA